MTARPQDDLAIKAASLSRAAPPEWEAFMKALDAYAGQQREMLVNALPVELPVSQGVARGVSALLTLLIDCRKTTDKLTSNVSTFRNL